MKFYLTARGNGQSANGKLPVGAVECTQAQYEAAENWTVSDGKIVAKVLGTDAVLASAQSKQIRQLKRNCAAVIVDGFTSSALGAEYTYPSTPTDQTNLLAAGAAASVMAAQAGWTTPLWCESAAGVWDLVQHTAAQVAQVVTDFRTAVAAAQTKLAALKSSVAGETTVASVQAITW